MVTHVYDGDHQRVATVDGAGAVMSFEWDGKNVLTDLDDTGAAVAEYTLEPREFGSLISQRREGETSQYHFDAGTESL